MHNDIFQWPDGTWCYRDESYGWAYMSDDYTVLKFGTPEWVALAQPNRIT